MSYEGQIEKIKDFLAQYDFGIVLCSGMQNDAIISLISDIRDDPFFSRFLINPSTEKLEKIAQKMKSGEVAVLITNDFKSGFKSILYDRGVKGLILCNGPNVPERVAYLIIR